MSRKSFQLHEDLSKELNHEIDYRKLNTFSIRARRVTNEGASMSSKTNVDKGPKWLNGKEATILGSNRIGNDKTTAQVSATFSTIKE